MRVHDDVDMAGDWDVTGGAEDGARFVLEREADAPRAEFPHLDIRTRSGRGRRDPELLALSTPDTLLVLGTERRRGIRMRLRFSTATRLASTAPGPVVLVPGGSGEAQGPVVVGVDGSDASREAALLAAEEAERQGAELVVLHAWWRTARRGGRRSGGHPGEAVSRSSCATGAGGGTVGWDARTASTTRPATGTRTQKTCGQP